MTQKVALLVIHGIGEQKKYDTLDLFTRHLAIALQSASEHKVTISHKMMTLNNELEDAVRLSLANDQAPEIDTHEYYWAHNTERRIAFGETIKWLTHAADGARKFYDDNEHFAQKYEPFENGRFKKHWYLKDIGWVLRLVYGIDKITGKALPAFFDPIIRLLMKKPHEAIADRFGDIAVYANTDFKNKFYPIRQQVLEGAIAKIIALQSVYDRVIILGHSLGSMIAYEALNEINIRMNVDQKLAAAGNKLTDLITFGSPLDKTAFFLREHTLERECVKRLIYNHKNCFRWRDIEKFDFEGIETKSEVKNLLPHLRWINYWDKEDPISGHLDFYMNVENHQVDNRKKWGVAHNAYWHNLSMYQDIVKQTQLVQTAPLQQAQQAQQTQQPQPSQQPMRPMDVTTPPVTQPPASPDTFYSDDTFPPFTQTDEMQSPPNSPFQQENQYIH